MLPGYANIHTQTIDTDELTEKKLLLQVLRIDKVHPVISGNKLFKLHYFLEELKNRPGKTIVTFGGAYSNHLVATAYACRLQGIRCVGIVRGEAAPQPSHTLQHCIEYGMQLQFITREQYRQKDSDAFAEQLQRQYPGAVVIPEGGYSLPGAKGASLIAARIPGDVTHICCAAGTATTAAGILLAAKPHQKLLVFPVLKGLHDIEQRIHFLTAGKFNPRQLYINQDYHFGGYAKKTAALINFMNAFYRQCSVPTDFVYTGKLMFGVMDLVQKNFFDPGSKICCIHSGGLQGNASLPANTLTF